LQKANVIKLFAKPADSITRKRSNSVSFTLSAENLTIIFFQQSNILQFVKSLLAIDRQLSEGLSRSHAG